ncbi:hypothetical protein G7Y79_00001g001520 [Physcia stellaris]|nr:hypothetical protein G7Y79_00001g001520 [Physcia stellaris]
MKDMDDGGRNLDWEDVNDAEAVLSCACCKKDERLLYQELKQCGRCRKTLYCSRGCQKSHWTSHREFCAKGYSVTRSDPTLMPFLETLSGSFVPLADSSWLHSLPDYLVFRHIIDAYRLSRNEVYQNEEVASEGSLGSSDDDAFEGFERFLRFAEMQPGLLPDCCTRDRCSACQKLAVDKAGANSIYNALPTREALDYYGDDTIRLRALAEEVFRKGNFAISRSS